MNEHKIYFEEEKSFIFKYGSRKITQ